METTCRQEVLSRVRGLPLFRQPFFAFEDPRRFDKSKVLAIRGKRGIVDRELEGGGALVPPCSGELGGSGGPALIKSTSSC